MKIISLILCSHNGLNRIQTTLIALANLKIPEKTSVELIFIDSTSDLSMCEFVEKMWVDLGSTFHLVTQYQNIRGKVAAMQLGIRLSKGTYFVIIDDDNELQSDYLLFGLEYFQNNDNVGVLGGLGRLPKGLSVPHWFDKYAYNFACGPQNIKDGNVQPNRNVVYGAGMWVLREAYEKAIVNGFHFIFDFHGSNQKMKSFNNGGEDGELCWSIIFQGYEIHYYSKLKFIHNISPLKFSKQHKRMILDRKRKSSLLGSMYYRVYSMQNKNVKFFWLKELIYILINYVKNIKFEYTYFTTELKRNWSNVVLLLSMNNKYDELVNQILEFKNNSLIQRMYES
jgi:GT2 family glycosyltransferase